MIAACAQGEDPAAPGDLGGSDVDGGGGAGDQDGGGTVTLEEDAGFTQGKGGGGGGNVDASGGKDAATKMLDDASTGGGTDSGSTSTDSGTTVDAGCTLTTTNLLQNPGFDMGATVWTQTPSTIITTTANLPMIPPQSGGYAAWLGGDLSATDTLYQPVTIPATTVSLHVKGYRWLTTQELDSGYDVLTIETRSSGGTKLDTLDQLSPTKDTQDTDWVAFDYAVPTTHAAQTIQLALISKTDATFNTNFFIDSLEVDATYCK
jgi:hypothetical protein